MSSQNEYRMVVIYISVVAALGGLLFGLDQGFIANAGETLNKLYGLNTASAGNFNAILASGGIAGTICSGLFCRFFGRRNTLLIAGFSFLVGSAYSSTLPSLDMLTACRFILGFGVGLASFATPLYLAETAPAKVRGAMSTLFQLMITFGIFLICLTNIVIVEFVGHTQISLTLMFSVISVFAFLMFAGCFMLPKSPRWLMMKGHENQARLVLAKTRPPEEIDSEIKEIKDKINEKGYSVSHTLKQRFFWKVLIVGMIIQMFQQLVGINAMIYYAPTFLSDAGLNIILAGLAVFFVNFISTIPAIMWVEKWGRKKLLTVGATIMMVALISVSICFWLLNVVGVHSEIPKYVLLVSCLVYIFGFACSWGPVAWIICSEIFPQKVREIGMTVTTVVNWTFAGIVISKSNVIMSSGVWGKPIMFIIYAVFCVLAIIFLKKFVPETKGVSLEKIESDLLSGVKLKDLGNATKV